MLVKGLYTIESQTVENGTIHTAIQLDSTHNIYKGHFPQQPVLPGVCMMQIVTETTGNALGELLKLQLSNQSKFLIPIVPDKNPTLLVETKYTKGEANEIKVSSSIKSGEHTFFKFKGTLG